MPGLSGNTRFSPIRGILQDESWNSGKVAVAPSFVGTDNLLHSTTTILLRQLCADVSSAPFERVLLLGHSFGAYLALAASLKLPDQVCGVVAWDASLEPMEIVSGLSGEDAVLAARFQADADGQKSYASLLREQKVPTLFIGATKGAWPNIRRRIEGVSGLVECVEVLSTHNFEDEGVLLELMQITKAFLTKTIVAR